MPGGRRRKVGQRSRLNLGCPVVAQTLRVLGGEASGQFIQGQAAPGSPSEMISRVSVVGKKALSCTTSFMKMAYGGLNSSVSRRPLPMVLVTLEEFVFKL